MSPIITGHSISSYVSYLPNTVSQNKWYRLMDMLYGLKHTIISSYNLHRSNGAAEQSVWSERWTTHCWKKHTEGNRPRPMGHRTTPQGQRWLKRRPRSRRRRLKLTVAHLPWSRPQRKQKEYRDLKIQRDWQKITHSWVIDNSTIERWILEGQVNVCGTWTLDMLMSFRSVNKVSW